MKLFLIDGHALVFKMYYAFLGRPMVNSKGNDTSIIFGFTKYLLELIRRERPTHLAVSFDLPGGTFRNRLYPEYKANRPPTPQLVIDSLEPLTRIVRALDIPVITAEGFEADDVIGTLARKFASDGMEVYMVTPDKDYGQLVAPGIFQYKPGHKSGENDILGVREICDKWTIDNPDQVIDMLAICGDASDNVPGVNGVGQVGASKMIRKYGSLEAIYEHLDELAPRQRQMFAEAADHIGLSKTLVTIKTDVPLDVSLSQLEMTVALNDRSAAIFDEFEMPSLKRQLSGLGNVREGNVVQCAGRELAAESGIDTVALWLSSDGETLYVLDGENPVSGPVEKFRGMLEDASKAKSGYNLKALLKVLSSKGMELTGRLFDIELMHYLLAPEESHSLESLSESLLGAKLDSDRNGEISLFDNVGADSAGDCEAKVRTVRTLASVLYAKLKSSPAIMRLYETIEEPLMKVLAGMELTGVKFDLDSLRDFSESLRVRMLDREAYVRGLAGEPDLNLSSPKQIGETLFVKMKIDPSVKKPRNGNWPTDENTLQELYDRSPIIDAILEYRGLRKLLSSYIEPFPSYVSPVDGRVHTTFNQALTSTGRLSSSAPNLQNIPVRTEQGREIRKAFIPGSEGYVMMSADYSQIELRIMAHLCGDGHLTEAFNRGEDIHAATASKIFGVDVLQVTPEQRRVAKTANFGIMYGISSFGLSQRLKCSRTEAKQIIDDYFTSFPSIREFIDGTLSSARINGYVETLFGRRRYVPDVNSSNGNVRAFAERNAVNAPIQGTAADIIKLAMIAVDRRLSENGLSSKTVLQIHDELVLEVPESEIVNVKNILISEMEGVIKLSVPLLVECNYGKNWLEAHR